MRIPKHLTFSAAVSLILDSLLKIGPEAGQVFAHDPMSIVTRARLILRRRSWSTLPAVHDPRKIYVIAFKKSEPKNNRQSCIQTINLYFWKQPVF